MQYEISSENERIIIRLFGDLDHHMSSIIKNDIDERISREGVKNIVFDFKNASFMDSSGIGLIMGRYKLLSKKGGTISIINTSKSINRIFEISGLYKLVNIL